MKLSVAVAAADAPPPAFVVWRGFEESFRKASEYGYHGVELALKDAGEVEPKKLERWLSRYNLEVSAISTGQVFAVLNLYFTHPDAEFRRRVIEVFTRMIGLAKDFGKAVNAGRVRGFYSEKQPREEVERLFTETIMHLCDVAEPLGVAILIEPVNRYETNFMNSLQEAAQWVYRLKRLGLGLMPDLFHMNIEDSRIGESLIRHANIVQYIHLADSNRKAPGHGHIDFEEVFSSLKKIGFHGWTSVEILPRPNPDQAARDAAEYILPFIERYSV